MRPSDAGSEQPARDSKSCCVQRRRSAAAFKQHADEIDLVITDRAMPGMTGSDLALAFTKDDLGAAIRSAMPRRVANGD